MVSKHIYFFWGNSVMSWMRYMTLYSFCKFNPEWDITLYLSKHDVNNKTWRMKNIQDFFSYKGENYIDKIHDLGITVEVTEEYRDMTPSHASNFFKWDILANSGGIYADMDILWVKPFDDFYDSFKDYDVAICQTDMVSIGLLGSSGNKFFGDILENTFKNYNKSRYQSAGVESIYDLYNCDHGDVFKEGINSYPYLKFFNIPMEVVYPFSSKQTDMVFGGDGELSRATIGYHWYAGHPTAQKYNNILTGENYKEYNTLFTKLCSII